MGVIGGSHRGPGIPVSYTHLDVYKRQIHSRGETDDSGRDSAAWGDAGGGLPKAQRQSGAGVPVASGGAAGDDGGLAAGGQSGQESARRADGSTDGRAGADAPRGGGDHGGESGVEKKL